MKKEETERLKHRNQYILAPGQIECPFQHNCYVIHKQYAIYTHKDLLVTNIDTGQIRIWLLGDIFDSRAPQKSNSNILDDLADYNFDSLLEEIGSYSGRFILLCCSENQFKLIHDTIASRKVYYGFLNQKVWIASRPHLLASVAGLNRTTDSEKLAYYDSEIFLKLNSAGLGDMTEYDKIKQLMPNHYLDLDVFSTTRYWPSKRLDDQDVNLVVKQVAQMLEGFMDSIANRYNIMLPVTAGKDSRTLLAATKRFPEKVYYYVNRERRLNERSPDIAVPKKLLSRLGLKFHIVDPYIKVDNEFSKIYFENHSNASKEYLPLIYNYYLHFPDKVNLPGNSASAGLIVYKGRKMRISGKNLARINNVEQYGFAVEYYNRWVLECRDLCKKYNMNMISLFYWEERLGNWGTQLQMEKDIAQEDINPFNSRDLASLYLSVKPKYILPPYNRLHKRIIRELWPETLSMPINPGLRTTALKIARTIGLLEVYHRIKFSRINKY